MSNVYYTIKRTQKSSHKIKHDHTPIHAYTCRRLYLVGQGLPSLIKVTVNGYYKFKCSKKSTHTPTHIYTPLYHYYNYQFNILHKINENNPINNRAKPIFVENLYYLDCKYIKCYLLFSPEQNAEFIRNFLHLLEPAPLLFIPSNYLSCNPVSTNLIFLNG